MKKKNPISIIITIIAIVLCIASFVGCSSNRQTAVTQLSDSGVIFLKVNPEISISYDADGLVTGIEARNDDAAKLIANYTGYEGKECKLVVSELVTAIGEAGYFIEEVDGTSRKIVIEIERGSVLPSQTFIDDIVSNVSALVNSNQWNSPVQIQGITDYGLTDYNDPYNTDYGPNNDGITDFFNTDYGPDSDGITDFFDTDYGPNNDGVTDYNDTDYGPNSDGITDFFDTDYGPNNDGVTDYNDTDYGPGNDGITDFLDTDYGPNNDGITDFGVTNHIAPSRSPSDVPANTTVEIYVDTDYGPNNDGVTDYNDTDYGPNNDGVTDYNRGSSNYGSSNYGDFGYGSSDYDD